MNPLRPQSRSSGVKGGEVRTTGSGSHIQELCLSPPSFANPKSAVLFLQVNKEQSSEKLAVISWHSHVRQLQETMNTLSFSLFMNKRQLIPAVCRSGLYALLTFSLSHGHLYAADIWDGDRRCRSVHSLLGNPNHTGRGHPLNSQSLSRCQASSRRPPRHPLPERPRRRRRVRAQTPRAQNRRGQATNAPQPVSPPTFRALPSLRQPQTAGAAAAVLPRGIPRQRQGRLRWRWQLPPHAQDAVYRICASAGPG